MLLHRSPAVILHTSLLDHHPTSQRVFLLHNRLIGLLCSLLVSLQGSLQTRHQCSHHNNQLESRVCNLPVYRRVSQLSLLLVSRLISLLFSQVCSLLVIQPCSLLWLRLHNPLVILRDSQLWHPLYDLRPSHPANRLACLPVSRVDSQLVCRQCNPHLNRPDAQQTSRLSIRHHNPAANPLVNQAEFRRGNPLISRVEILLASPQIHHRGSPVPLRRISLPVNLLNNPRLNRAVSPHQIHRVNLLMRLHNSLLLNLRLFLLVNPLACRLDNRLFDLHANLQTFLPASRRNNRLANLQLNRQCSQLFSRVASHLLNLLDCRLFNRAGSQALNLLNSLSVLLLLSRVHHPRHSPVSSQVANQAPNLQEFHLSNLLVLLLSNQLAIHRNSL